MTISTLTFATAAREKNLLGKFSPAELVHFTLDPKYKSMLIQRKGTTPLVGTEGASNAKALEAEAPKENLGTQMLRQAVEKTAETQSEPKTPTSGIPTASSSESRVCWSS